RPSPPPCPYTTLFRSSGGFLSGWSTTRLHTEQCHRRGVGLLARFFDWVICPAPRLPSASSPHPPPAKAARSPDRSFRPTAGTERSEEHTSELQSREKL